MTRHKHHRVKLRSMYQWHRYFGVAIALFVILLSVTGMLLNHTVQLALDKRYVQSNWLLGWYGISAPEQIRSYHTAQAGSASGGNDCFWKTGSWGVIPINSSVLSNTTIC